MSGRAVPPVGSIGTMAGRQDSRTVLQGYTDDLGLVIGGNLQHVADTRGQVVARRHLSFLAVGTNALHRLVTAAIGALSVDIEIVAADAVQGRCRARIDARVTNGGHCRHVVDHGVLEAEPLIDEFTETALAILVIIIVEVVPTHLVHHETYHKLGPLNFGHC